MQSDKCAGEPFPSNIKNGHFMSKDVSIRWIMFSKEQGGNIAIA
jgi:hypothetical protein